MDFRAYARAKEVYDSTPMDKRPRTKIMAKVSEITMELAKEKIKKFQEENPNG